ncbi:MAG: hypothetical protein R3C49_00730 [Planctomycetaceae bacterium]
MGPTADAVVHYIVSELFSQREIDAWVLLVESERKGMNRAFAVERLTAAIAIMSPYVDQPVVRAGVWIRGHLYTLYIDRMTGQTIYRASAESAAPAFADGPGCDAEHNKGPAPG